MGHTFTGLTFEQLRDDIPERTIVHDRTITKGKDGPAKVRFIIVRGLGSLCAYVGVPDDHPLAGREPEDLKDVPCHFGLTFSGTGPAHPKGWYWYGWDYAHAGDESFFYPQMGGPKWTKWTVPMVVDDSRPTVQAFCRVVWNADKQRSKVPAKVLAHCTMVTFHEGRKFRED